MFVLVTSVGILLVAFHLITKTFGLWAGVTVAGLHVVNLLVDHFVAGDLTTFRQIFYSILGFLLLVAYFKTREKLEI